MKKPREGVAGRLEFCFEAGNFAQVPVAAGGLIVEPT